MAFAEDFIRNAAEHCFNKSNLKVSVKSEEAIKNFIHNPQVLLIQSYLQDDQTLVYSTNVMGNKEKSVIFYKEVAQNLTNADTINSVNIITLQSSAVESLYHIVRQIYSPLLANGSDLYSNKLQKNLSELESNLRILSYGKGNEKCNVILSIEDEIEYWKTLGQKKDITKKEKEAVSHFNELFEDICEEIRSMQSSPMSEMREITENIGGILDDIWRFTVFPYSQDRMIHIFDIIGHTLCTIVQRSITNTDLWRVNNTSSDNEIITQLTDGLNIVNTWISACKSLTETYWPNYALHSWQGKSYVPLFCNNLHCKLKEIHDIRAVYYQLNKLLTNSEREELKIIQLFDPFKNVNIWMYNAPNYAWEVAMSRFSTNLKPAEMKVAEKLKPRLRNTSTKQMLYEFLRYKTLIERPLVKQALNSELEIFISSLISMLKSIKQQLEVDDLDIKMYQPPEMSPLVQQIQWLKQIEAKVLDIQTCAESYLKEFGSSKELLSLCMDMLKELKSTYTTLHEEWCRDLQAQVKNGVLTLSSDKPVVEFSARDRMMVVNFNPRAVWVETEARSLAALGLPAPAAASALDILSDDLQHARALQQVASFHNTLSERMIPSTRPMMLQAALDLSSLVQNQTVVYWDDPQLPQYTEKLRSSVLKLESQNSYLTNQHIAIRKIIEKLMDTELLDKQSEWKKYIKEIRNIIENVEVNGYKSTDVWRSHWDWQLYKALECQYIKTLLSLHKHFPHVKVDLVLRGRRVRSQPPIEELRVQYYHQLRRLVALPAHFVGLQNNVTSGQSIFAAIVDKHGWLGNKAVKQLEDAVAELQRTCDTWTKRAALACVPDLEALCSGHLREPQDWETNFKACKAYGQAVAKMTFEDEKIHWISIGTITLRREFEAQTRNLWTVLMSTLQTNCRDDALALDTFIANATLLVEDKTIPKNTKELADISGKQQAVKEKLPEMEKIVENLKRKAHLLRTWGGDASVDSTITEWQKIHELLMSHQQMFEHQAEIVKSSLTGEWENLNTSVEGWLSRWTQSKSQYEETRGVDYTEIIDRCRSVFEVCEQWNKFVSEKDELMNECEKFGMKLVLSETWTRAAKIIADDVALWTILKEYNEEFEDLANQEWILFQKKLHLLDEFSCKWSEKLEPYTPVTLFMYQQLEKYSDLPTLLKYLRGTDFTERHWHEVFGLLNMEYRKPDELKLKDWLAVALDIKKNIKELQKICASASSEAAIRSTLNELELWYAGARLTVIYYIDKGKKSVPIVKDFKQILLKVSEQQYGVGGAGEGGACGAWEARLRGAAALLHAAARAQRRSKIEMSDKDET